MARGRPRNFDPDTVLDKAVDVLWRSGPHGVSLNDLSHELGVAKPALAKVFGGKDELIAQALRRYYDRTVCIADEAIAEASSPGAVAESYVGAFVRILIEQSGQAPTGCFIAAATETYACMTDGPVREAIDDLRARQLASLRDKLAEVGATDPDGQAQFILGQTVALAFFSRSGANQATLEAFAARAIAASGT